MSKSKDNNNEVKFVKAFAKLYEMCIDMTQKDLEFAYVRKDMWIQIRNDYCDMKPFKIFKRDYERWENRLREIDDTIKRIDDSIEIISQDYYNLLIREN